MKSPKSFILLMVSTFLFLASCNKCYDCTKKCGNCVHPTKMPLSGCTGDSQLSGMSLEAWKVYLETNEGYTCTYANVTEEACGKENKKNKENAYYECVSK